MCFNSLPLGLSSMFPLSHVWPVGTSSTWLLSFSTRSPYPWINSLLWGCSCILPAQALESAIAPRSPVPFGRDRVFRDPSLGTWGAHSQWMLRHGFSASSWVQLGESQGWSLLWVDTETSNLSSGLPDFYLKCLSFICISIFLGQEYGTLCPHASACPASLWRVPQEVLTREIFWVLSCLEQFICSIYSLMSIWLDKKYKIVFSLLC